MFATDLTVVCRRRSIIVVTLGAVGFSALLPGSIVSAAGDYPLPQTQVQNPGRGCAHSAKAASPMSRRMATWDSRRKSQNRSGEKRASAR